MHCCSVVISHKLCKVELQKTLDTIPFDLVIMSYSSKFQQEWLTMPQFKDWIIKHESPFKAYCKLCSKAMELSNMGKRALTSHADSKVHKKAVSLMRGATKME